MLTRMARLLIRMARMLTRMTRMARMLTRWLAGSHIIHTRWVPLILRLLTRQLREIVSQLVIADALFSAGEIGAFSG